MTVDELGQHHLLHLLEQVHNYTGLLHQPLHPISTTLDLLLVLIVHDLGAAHVASENIEKWVHQHAGIEVGEGLLAPRANEALRVELLR